MIKVGNFGFKKDSADGIDVLIEVKNETGKTIKYVSLWLIAFNAVDDAVASEIDGETVKVMKITGPIENNSWYGYGLVAKSMWYNGTITRINIAKALIEYMDGTTEEVEGKDIPVLTSKEVYEDKYGKMDVSSHKSKKGCYVATCVYQSYDCPQVWCLRRYRDYYLDQHWWGKAFIKLYYSISPTIVKLFGKTRIFRASMKKILDKKIKKLEIKGYESTRYEDKY